MFQAQRHRKLPRKGSIPHPRGRPHAHVFPERDLHDHKDPEARLWFLLIQLGRKRARSNVIRLGVSLLLHQNIILDLVLLAHRDRDCPVPARSDVVQENVRPDGCRYKVGEVLACCAA